MDNHRLPVTVHPRPSRAPLRGTCLLLACPLSRLDADAHFSSNVGYAQNFLQNPYYFMFASLAKPDDDAELHWLKVCIKPITL
jgi:hypothetical protein